MSGIINFDDEEAHNKEENNNKNENDEEMGNQQQEEENQDEHQKKQDQNINEDQNLNKSTKLSPIQLQRQADYMARIQKDPTGTFDYEFIQRFFTPLYLLFIYYGVYGTITLYCLSQINNWQNPFQTNIIIGVLLGVQLIKAIFIFILMDEWLDELPYIDTVGGRYFRGFMLFILIITNTDIIYWVYQIYINKKRDGIIEHMLSICKLIEALFLNFPLMFYFLYLQINNIDTFYLPYLVISGINLLAIVNAFMLLNFFIGSSLLSIRWSIQYICELYLKTLLICSNLILLQKSHIEIYYFGLYILFGLLQFYFFSVDTGFFTQLISIVFYQLKTFFIITFRETSFGMEKLDCDAQPDILTISIDNELYTYIQKALNFCQVISLTFLFWFLNGLELVKNKENLQILFYIGLGCFGIQLLNSLYILISGWIKHMGPEDDEII